MDSKAAFTEGGSIEGLSASPAHARSSPKTRLCAPKVGEDVERSSALNQSVVFFYVEDSSSDLRPFEVKRRHHRQRFGEPQIDGATLNQKA
jgi:hypothetical protein